MFYRVLIFVICNVFFLRISIIPGTKMFIKDLLRARTNDVRLLSRYDAAIVDAIESDSQPRPLCDLEI